MHGGDAAGPAGPGECVLSVRRRSAALPDAPAVDANLGRAALAQPDTSDDGTCLIYEQFSLYNNFAQPELFMPWSIGFVLLAEPDFAEVALRNVLSKNLHGPLGLRDSGRWMTGQPDPTSTPARIDF